MIRKYGLIYEQNKVTVDKVNFIINEKLSINPSIAENIIIEGENLTALEKLSDNYINSIDVIYIDPPYNTNIKKLSYKDDFFEKEFSYPHSGWLSFMKQRLDVSYRLLTDTGVLFISIDDTEIAQLLLLVYDIFGENNVDTIIWPKVNSLFDQNRVEKEFTHIKSEHEYIITCFKNKKIKKLNNIKIPELIDNKWIEKEYPLKSILHNLGTTSSAKDELFEIFGDRYKFLTPKPMKLIKELIRSASKRNSTILDFFAGSGTTGHSVICLNQEDRGHRNFILINNNENNICREVTYERIK